MAQALTVLELSARCGEPVETLEAWCAAGLIGTERSVFSLEDVQRVRLIQFLLRRGFELDAIAQANREAGIVTSHVELLSADGVRQQTFTLEEASRRLGWSLKTIERFLEALGLNDRTACLDEEDIQALEGFRLGKDAGLPEEALLELVRVYADALGRVAEAEVRLFHFHIHEPLKAKGLSPQQLRDATADARRRASPLMEPSLLYFHRRGLERAMRDDALLHLEEDVARLGGELHAAVIFVDLASFTPMTEAMGDRAAAEILERFGRFVRDAVRRHDGRVVKQIGDAFMLLFPKARDALGCALVIEERTAEQAQFSAVRSGIHCGRVLYRDGDYLGTTVNVAARLVDEANRHQILLTAAVRDAVSTVPGVEFAPLGTRSLKGLSEPVEVFAAARSVRAEREERSLDPVCGMELRRDEIAAGLSLGGAPLSFCSNECLQRYVAAPEKYAAAWK